MKNFLANIKNEYSKVTWPGKQEILNATTLVVVLSVALGIYVGAFDIIFKKILDTVIAFFGG